MPSRSIAKFFAVLAISVGLTACNPLYNYSLALEVYYDPYDIPSQDFLKNQIAPTAQKVGLDWIKIELVPYGLATTTWGSAPDEPPCKVVCHNKAKTCDLVKYAACGFDAIMLRHKDHKKYVDFGTCVTSPSFFIPKSKCAVDAGLTGDTDPYECAKSRLGDDLLCEYGLITPKNITTLPLVYVNNYNPPKPVHDEIMKNLIKYACDFLKQKPPGCKTKYVPTTSSETEATDSIPTEWLTTPEP